MLQIAHILVLSQPAFVEDRLCRVLDDGRCRTSRAGLFKAWRRN